MKLQFGIITFILSIASLASAQQVATPTFDPDGGTSVFHVKTDGSDQNDGLTWDTAKQTIQAAVSLANSGDEVWVAKGTYSGPVYLSDGVELYGGFAGGESTLEQRDLKANKTILDAGQGYGIKAMTGYSTAVVDGFTILTGYGGTGVWCDEASATVRNNVISQADGPTGGMGIRLGYSVNPYPYVVANNLIVGKSWGIWFSRGHAGLIANNTIVGSSVMAIRLERTKVTLVNNIIAFNARGVGQGYRAEVTMDHNCVFGNILYDYVGEFPHPTDINVDPLFAESSYRLRFDSPCIDAGTNEGAPPTDIEGSIRPMDGNHDGLAVADIGAYESPMPVQVDVLHDTVRLQPNKLVQVAILSDPVFNALRVDPATVFFGSGNAQEIHGKGHPEDVNGDGLTDLLFHFSCAESGIVPGYQTVFLQGKLKTGEDFIGWDNVTAR
ncbi:MAG TPA: DUF1565 domain-containing protein [Armatimonadota bacterium]|nr:DUF1565 domain-containing protein [Armatimonadota bacterium]